MILNVNTDALVILTNKLEKLNRSAFPVAVRSTLNSAALDMKQKTIISSSDDNFIKRKPSFFKAASKVNFATGFAVNSMSSTVGFKGDSQAVDDLEQQEKGGDIDSRSFVPMNPARVGGAYKKNIRPNARLKALKIVDAKNAKGANDKEKFIKSVIHAGVGGAVLADYKDKKIVWRVNSLNKTDLKTLKLTPLYTYEKGRKVKVDRTDFIKEAAAVTQQKIDGFYIASAQKQFDKALR